MQRIKVYIFSSFIMFGYIMSEQEIIAAIEQRVGSKISIWTIGITDNPERRKKEHGDPKYWMQWRADSEIIARNVEKHFLEKEMKGGGGGGDNPNYVYIF